MSRPKVILCDFDGVLSRFDQSSKQEGFYSLLATEHPALHNNVIDFLFTSGNHLRKSWMCGEISYTDINALMAHRFGVAKDYLDAVLLKSIQQFTLNQHLIALLQQFRRFGTTVVIMSDNMDVFTQYVVPHFGLHTLFDEIFSSSDLRKMKSYNNWELPREIAEKYGCDYADVLAIDDWEELTTSLLKLGFRTFLYNEATQASFEAYANTVA